MRNVAALFALALPALMLALSPDTATPPAAYQPSPDAIERAVALAHAEAEAAGGKPGKLDRR